MTVWNDEKTCNFLYQIYQLKYLGNTENILYQISCIGQKYIWTQIY